jgi:uncharacterized protein involved in exopolysaccharide biosynthesis
LCGLIGLVLVMFQPVRFTGHASFFVTAVPRPAPSVVSTGGPGVPMLAGGGASPIDLQVAILRSQLVADRLIERFNLLRAWNLRHPAQARAMLARRMEFNIARREGVVHVEVEDEHPQRAAALANQAVEELRLLLRGFSLEEARQRREFYEGQLEKARANLEQARARLQGSGFDRGALRAEPGAVASAYSRHRAEIAAAEVRLAALRRVRAQESPEVQQALAEVNALRAQLATLAAPAEDRPGVFTERLRELRNAEALLDSMARQVEAARVDEAANPSPLQWLDRAEPPLAPSKPRLLMWPLVGVVLGFLLQSGWVLLRHRSRLAQSDAVYRERLALVRSALAPNAARVPWWRRWQRWRQARRLGDSAPVAEQAQV